MSIWFDKAGNRHVTVSVRGLRAHRRCPKGASSRDAKRLEQDLITSLTLELERLAENQANHSLQGTASANTPLLIVMELYMEHTKVLRSPKTAQFHAARILPWLKDNPAHQAQKCAARIIRDMQGHYQPATINRSLGTLKKALRLAWEQDLIPEDYGAKIHRLPEKNERHVYISIDQVHHLTQFASESVAAAIWIALLTGCRRGEIIKMVRDDISQDVLTIRANNTKIQKIRTVPIIAPLRRWLEYIPLSISEEGLKTGFRRAREKAGMPWLHFHDLRHSCASILLASGVDLYTIAKVLGHSTIRMTERYAHLQVQAQREAMEKAFSQINDGGS